MIVLPPFADVESPAAKEASPALDEVEAPPSREMAPPAVSPEPTVSAISPPDADVESPVAIDMAPEFATEELSVARLRSPLQDPKLLSLAFTVAKEIASSPDDEPGASNNSNANLRLKSAD